MDWLFNKITMKISLIFFIYLGIIVSAKKRKIRLASSSEESIEILPFVDDALDLRGEVRKRFALEVATAEPRLSMICSPVSVLIPLGNLVLGAKGKTREELLFAIGLSSSKQLNPAFTHLITNMKYVEGVTLDVVSRIYISSKKDIKDKFERNTKLIFGSSTQKFNPSYPRKVAQSINEWVSENTRHKINHLVSESDITEDTSMILVNAIYFAGKWRNKFEKTLTKYFHSSMGTRQLSMMSREGVYNYWMSDELNAQVIEIPYEGSHVTMIIVLPISTRGLTDLLRNLKHSPEPLNSALKKMKATDIKLTIPRFKVETKLNLSPLYEKMGVTNMFSRYSELSGIIEDENVFVTRAIHKAVIDVAEEGTEASAATAIFVGVQSAMPTTPIEFTASHPFYFVIRMNQEQLFAGTFNGG